MKKFKVLILTLVLFAVPLMTNNIDAQTINSVPTQGIFSSIGDFFGNLFGGDNQEAVAHKDTRDIDPTVDKATGYAKNTAYGCTGTGCDSGTDIVDLNDIDGIDIDKEMSGATNAGTAVAPTVGDEIVNVKLQITNTGNIDGASTVTVTDELIEDYILYSGNVTAKAITDKNADLSGSGATSTAAAALNSLTAVEVTPDVTDLRSANGGVTFTGFDAGDQFEVAFIGKVKTNRPQGTTSAQTENDAQACKPYTRITSGALDTSDEYDYIHLNEDGQLDGTITGSAEPYTLCDTGSDNIYVKWTGDPIITPGLDDISAEKSVTDGGTGVADLAEPGETLTYSFFVQNEGDAAGTVIVKDELNDPSLVKNTNISDLLAASTPQNLVSQYGDLKLNQTSGNALYGKYDSSADPINIVDLQSGFAVTLEPEEYLEFSFTVTVNAEADMDYFSLHNGSDIYNIATVCEDKPLTPTCTDIEGLIPVDPASDLEATKDVIAIDHKAVNELNPPVIDSSTAGSGPLDEVTTGTPTHEIVYKVNFKNNSSVDENVTLRDTRSSVYLQIPAAPKDALFNIVTVGTVTTKETDFTVGNLSDADGILVKMGPQSSVSFEYRMYTNKAFNDDVAAGKDFTSEQLANIASTCIFDGSVTSDCDEDGGLIGIDVTPMEDGNIDVIKSSQISGADTTGNAIEGTIATYTFKINNDTKSSQIINVNDPLDDQSFDHGVSDANPLYLSETALDGAPLSDTSEYTTSVSTTGVTHAKFVNDDGTDHSGYTVADLANPSKPVYIEVAADAVTYLSFDMTLTVKDLVDKPGDDAIDVENTVEACIPSDVASAPTVFDDCTDGGNVIDLLGTKSLEIKKDVTDVTGGSGDNTLAEPGDTLHYTITIQNKGTETIESVQVTDQILSGFYDEAYINDTANKAIVSVSQLGGVTQGELDVPKEISNGNPTDGIGTIPLANLYGATDSIKILNLAPSGIITIEFDMLIQEDSVTGEFPTDIAGIVGQEVSNTACTYYTEPISKTITSAQDVKACSTAEIPTDTNDRLEPEDQNVDVEKQIVDINSATTPNGIAEAGETLTMQFIVTNETTEKEVVRIEEMNTGDGKVDPNLDWSAAVTNEVSADVSGSLVTDMTGTTPIDSATPLKVGDLVTVTEDATGNETVTLKKPMYVAVEPEETVTVSFDVNVVDIYLTSTPPVIEYNNAIYTSNETITDALDETNATPIAGTIPTPGFENLSILKTVEKSVDAGGTELDTTFTDKTLAPYGKAGGAVDYKIVIKNTGSLPVQDLSVQDVVNEDYFKPYDVSANPMTVAVSSSDGVYSATSVDMATLNNPATVAYPSGATNAFDPEETLTLTFTAQLRDDLGDYYDTEEMIPNTAEVCYSTDTPYNMNFPTPGDYCYSSGVDLPFVEEGDAITDLDPDDPNFSIEKRSDVGSDLILDPNEDITYNIYVTNNGIETDSTTGDVLDQQIVLTDEMFEENIDYANHINTDSNLEVKNLGAIGSATDTLTPIVDIKDPADTDGDGDGWLSNNDLTTNPIPAYYLLKRSDATDWVTSTGATAGTLDATDWRADTAKFPDEHRGGIRLTIPANNTYVVSFTVKANGEFKMINKVKNFFDFKRFF